MINLKKKNGKKYDMMRYILSIYCMQDAQKELCDKQFLMLLPIAVICQRHVHH